MSTCNIDHSNQDVRTKLESQREFMPEPLFVRVTAYLQSSPDQEHLNVLFHLLKKYDLVSNEEQEIRNLSIIQLLESGS